MTLRWQKNAPPLFIEAHALFVGAQHARPEGITVSAVTWDKVGSLHAMAAEPLSVSFYAGVPSV
jgi:hypothetical protein